MEIQNVILSIIVVLVLGVLLLLVLRELYCWYTKQNEQINLLKKQTFLLTKIVEGLNPSSKKIPPKHEIVNEQLEPQKV